MGNQDCVSLWQPPLNSSGMASVAPWRVLSLSSPPALIPAKLGCPTLSWPFYLLGKEAQWLPQTSCAAEPKQSLNAVDRPPSHPSEQDRLSCLHLCWHGGTTLQGATIHDTTHRVVALQLSEVRVWTVASSAAQVLANHQPSELHTRHLFTAERLQNYWWNGKGTEGKLSLLIHQWRDCGSGPGRVVWWAAQWTPSRNKRTYVVKVCVLRGGKVLCLKGWDNGSQDTALFSFLQLRAEKYLKDCWLLGRNQELGWGGVGLIYRRGSKQRTEDLFGHSFWVWLISFAC